MGPLQARISEDVKTAMKARDKDVLVVLRGLVAALKDKQLALAKDELSEGEELAVLHKAVKSRRDTVEQARAAGRDDVVARELAEIAVVERYLPQAMAPDELAAAVRALAAEIGWSGPKDTGRFMKEWMARHRGRADGRDVQQALESLG